MKFIFALCLVTFAECSVHPPVPVHPNAAQIQQTSLYGMARVIGGNDADICEYPWQLSLMFLGKHICGAVAISDTVALTAAHCVAWASTSFFSVRVGSSSRKRAGLVFDVAEKILHEDFGEGSGSFPNDIAILKFSESIIGPGAAYVALLPEDDNDFAHERCDISGWGFSQFGLGLPEVLQAAKMTVLSEECCAASYEDIGYDSINAGHVCVVSPNSDSCIGDSGGPLTCGNTLVGLTSFGVIGCLPGFPAAYTRITHFRQWIKDNSGI